MSMPHGTVEADGHAPQQTRSVGRLVPGGLTQLSVAGHAVPVPVQSRHTRPSPSRGSRIGSPQATSRVAGQRGQHEPMRHSAPVGHRVPVPVQVALPMQLSGTSSPQSTMSGVRHVSVQVHMPATQVRPSVQGPSQRPPQPSESPHAASAAQLGMHSQRPVSGLHSSRGPAQGPTQKPPQPSGSPHAASAAQRGMHVHTPAMQRSGAMHGGSQPQVCTQLPFWQTSPRAQVTPKQGFGRQVPARQNSPSAQLTPSHAERGVQVRWQARSVPHAASQGTTSAQAPREGSQY
jgi:hypothetical protein